MWQEERPPAGKIFRVGIRRERPRTNVKLNARTDCSKDRLFQAVGCVKAPSDEGGSLIFIAMLNVFPKVFFQFQEADHNPLILN